MGAPTHLEIDGVWRRQDSQEGFLVQPGKPAQITNLAVIRGLNSMGNNRSLLRFHWARVLQNPAISLMDPVSWNGCGNASKSLTLFANMQGRFCLRNMADSSRSDSFKSVLCALVYKSFRPKTICQVADIAMRTFNKHNIIIEI